MDRNLDAFLAVARASTLTEAAERIGVTQPSVTKRIANLEDMLGATLFERHRRGMSLTPAGRVFLERATRIETEYRQSLEEIEIIGSAGMTVLRVGAGPLFHLNCVAALFTELKSRFPHLQLELSTDVNLPTSELLNEGALDVYMGVIPPEHVNETLHVKYVTEVEHGIVLRADHPLASGTSIDPSMLRQYSWVIFAVDPETEQAIQDYLVSGPLDRPIIDVRTTSFNTGLQLVQRGDFVMSAPLQLAPVIEAAGLVILPVEQGMPRRQAGVYVRQSALGHGVIGALLKFFDGFQFPHQGARR